MEHCLESGMLSFVSNVRLKYAPKWMVSSLIFFSGEGLTEPLPRPLPPFFLGLRPWFGLRPQFSGASRLRLGLRPWISGASRPRLGLRPRFTGASRPRFVASPSTKLALNFLMKSLVWSPQKFLYPSSIYPPQNVHSPPSWGGLDKTLTHARGVILIPLILLISPKRLPCHFYMYVCRTLLDGIVTPLWYIPLLSIYETLPPVACPTTQRCPLSPAYNYATMSTIACPIT